MGASLSVYKKKTQLGMNNLPESLAKLGTDSKQVSETTEPTEPTEPTDNNSSKPELESNAKTFIMVPIPEISSINKNNQKLLMYYEPHSDDVNEMRNDENNQILDIEEVNKFNEPETFNKVQIPEKSTINRDNKELLIYDPDNQSNIFTEVNINKNSTLNSGNKNLLIY